MFIYSGTVSGRVIYARRVLLRQRLYPIAVPHPHPTRERTPPHPPGAGPTSLRRRAHLRGLLRFVRFLHSKCNATVMPCWFYGVLLFFLFSYYYLLFFFLFYFLSRENFETGLARFSRKCIFPTIFTVWDLTPSPLLRPLKIDASYRKSTLWFTWNNVFPCPVLKYQ